MWGKSKTKNDGLLAWVSPWPTRLDEWRAVPRSSKPLLAASAPDLGLVFSSRRSTGLQSNRYRYQVGIANELDMLLMMLAPKNFYISGQETRDGEVGL